jgi:hypothetical protein
MIALIIVLHVRYPPIGSFRRHCLFVCHVCFSFNDPIGPRVCKTYDLTDTSASLLPIGFQTTTVLAGQVTTALASYVAGDATVSTAANGEWRMATRQCRRSAPDESPEQRWRRIRDRTARIQRGKNRAGKEAGRFNGIEGQQQLLHRLVTSHHEIATGFVKVLQGTAGHRCAFTAGHGDFLLRARIVEGPITNRTHKDHTWQNSLLLLPRTALVRLHSHQWEQHQPAACLQLLRLGSRSVNPTPISVLSIGTWGLVSCARVSGSVASIASWSVRVKLGQLSQSPARARFRFRFGFGFGFGVRVRARVASNVSNYGGDRATSCSRGCTTRR